MKLNQADPSLIFAMLKGEPGTRKSTQALSFPLPQYWFSWDRKMNGILVPARNWNIDTSQIEYDDYDDWDKPRAKLERFTLKCEFKTLIVDSITTCGDMGLRQVRKSKGSAGKKIQTIPVDGLEEFNAESAILSELISLLKDIHLYHKINIVIIAHVIQADYKSVDNKETHVSRTIVTAAKKIAAKIPAVCGEIYHHNLKKGTTLQKESADQYGLWTTHTGDDYARTALDLPREILFNDQPLYGTYLKPAIDKLVEDMNKWKK